MSRRRGLLRAGLVLTATLGSAGFTSAIGACPPIEIGDASGDDVLIQADAGSLFESTATATPATGGGWSAFDADGSDVSTSGYTVFSTDGRIYATLWHTLQADGGKTVKADGSIILPIDIVLDENQGATVKIDVNRTVIPPSGATGTIVFSGFSGTTVNSSAGVYTQSVTQTVFVPGPVGPGPHTIEVGDFSFGADIDEGADLGGDELAVYTEIEVYVESADNCSPPSPETPDADDDPVVPCGGNGAVGGGFQPTTGSEPCDDEDDSEDDGEGCEAGGEGQEGDGLFMELARGNVWTQIPVFRAFAAGKTELNFFLRYESLRGHENGPLGYGWTHSYNRRVEQVTGKAIYYDANGRRHAFPTPSYTTPIGRRMKLQWVINHFEITWEDGREEVFDTSGRIESMKDRRGRTTRFKYGANGELSHIVSPHGRIVTLEYDGNDRLWKITDPAGELTELTYNGSGELTTIEDPLNKQVLFEYETHTSGSDTIHRVTKETHKNGSVYTADYIDTAPMRRTIYALDGSTPHRVVEVSAVGGLPHTRKDSISAGLVAMVDGRGKRWSIRRDNLGRMTSRVNSETGKHVDYTYGLTGNGRNRITKVTDRNGHSRTITYDPKGYVSKRTDAELHDFEFARADSNFYAFVTKYTEPDGDEWTYTYNTDGDITAITDPLVEVPTDKKRTFQYDTRSALNSVPSEVTTIDAAWTTLPGRIEEIRAFDREGHQVKLEYDGKGNLTKVTRGVGVLDMVTEYEYDDMGRRKKRTVHRDVSTDIVTEWQYDAMGRVNKIIEDPGVGNLALTTDLDYDGKGLLDKLTDPRGTIIDLDYDYRNRLIRRVVDSGVGGLALKTEWEVDGNGNVIRRRYPNHFKAGGPAHEATLEYNALNYLTKVTDDEGYVTEVDRDGVGNATEVRRETETVGGSPDWYTVKLTYDDINRVVTREINPLGLDLTTTIEYTAASGCSCGGSTPGTSTPYKIVDGEGKTTFLHFDELDRLTRVIRKVGTQTGETADTDDAETVFDYDANGNLIRIDGPENEVVVMEYDEANRRDKLIGDPTPGDNLTTTLKYDDADNIIEIAMPNGNVVDLVYDEVDRLVSTTDDLGQLFSLTYDENGNVKSSSTATTNQTWQFIYDRANRVTEVRDPIVETPTDKVSTYDYDPNGNRISRVDRLGVETAYKYDKLNRLIEMIEDFQDPPPSPATSTSNTSTFFGYNGVRQTSIKDHDDNETSYEYDAALRLIKATFPDADGIRKIVDFTYDDVGNLKTRKDQNSITTTYTYNDLHQLTRRAYDTTSRQEDYTWDRSGRLKTADNDTADLDFTYGNLGRLKSTIQAYADLTAYTTDLDYELANNDVRRIITYPNLREVTETRDQRFRLESVLNGTTIGANWTYDLGDRRTEAALGNLIEGAFQFDVNNRITKVNHATDVTDVLTSVFHVNYGYDAVGNRIYADHVSQGVSWTGFDEVYEHDNRHRLINFDRGTIDPLSLPNNPSLSSSLNDTEIPSQQSWDTTNGTLDARGNWTAFDETINGTTHEVEREHTPTNEATRNGGPIPGTSIYGGNRYVYDDAGNLIEVQLLGDMNCDGTLSVGDNNAFTLALTDPAQYALDYPDCPIEIGDFNGDGSVTVADINSFTDAITNRNGETGTLYDYDEENRLVSVTEAAAGPTLLEIEYDALGRRVLTRDHQAVLDPCDPSASTDSFETRHVLLGFQVIEEYTRGLCDDESTTSWTLAREFLWGERFPEPIAMVDHTAWGDVAAGTAEVLHYIRDTLGNVVGLTDAGDPNVNPAVEPELVERYIYDPYGKTYIETWNGSAWVRGTTSDYGNPFLWTGQRYDAGVELYHFVFRSYIPKLGRWMQRDPLGYVDGVSLYGYGGARPYSSRDVLGLSFWGGVWDGVSAGASWTWNRAVDASVATGGFIYGGARGVANVGVGAFQALTSPMDTASAVVSVAGDTYRNFRDDGSSPVVAAAATMLSGTVATAGGSNYLDAIEGHNAQGNQLTGFQRAAAAGEGAVDTVLTAVGVAGLRAANKARVARAARAAKAADAAGDAADIAKLLDDAPKTPPSPLPPASLTNEGARIWYHAQLRALRQWGRVALENGMRKLDVAFTVFSRRNDFKMEARRLMKDQEAAKALPPPQTWNDVMKKYDGDLDAIIEASTRTNEKVDKKLGLCPDGKKNGE